METFGVAWFIAIPLTIIVQGYRRSKVAEGKMGAVNLNKTNSRSSRVGAYPRTHGMTLTHHITLELIGTGQK
jgi:hypothetical protein